MCSPARVRWLPSFGMPPALEPGAGRQGVVGKMGLGQSGMAIGLVEEQSNGTGTACTRPLVREGRHYKCKHYHVEWTNPGADWAVAGSRGQRRKKIGQGWAK